MRSLARPAFGDFAFEQLADGVLDDVIDDVGGRVVDAAGLADLGLFLDLGLVAGGQADHLAQELLVDLAEDLGRQDARIHRGCRDSRGV